MLRVCFAQQYIADLAIASKEEKDIINNETNKAIADGTNWVTAIIFFLSIKT